MLLDLAFLILLAIIAAGVGLRVLTRLALKPDHPVDAWALAVPMGLGMLAMAVLGLAECGILTPAAIGGLLAVGAIAGGKGGSAATVGIFKAIAIPRTWPDRAIDGCLIVTFAGTLLTALTPVTDGDALCYHLQVPKVFLSAGSAVYDPDLHETIYPLVTESLYAIGLAARGPVACRLIQWLLGLVFAANVGAMARPVLGDRARWASAVAMLVPAISNGMSAPLNDVALAAFGNAALFAWTRWRDRSSLNAACLTGGMIGLAIGVKYPALVLAGLIGIFGRTGLCACCVGLKKTGTEARSTGMRHLIAFGVVAIVVGGPWYLRAYLHTGNPVYPFFRQVFGGSGIDEVLDPAKKAMVPSLWNVATAIVPMTLQPGRFDSVSHQFGPAFLLFLPALIWMRPPRRIWGLAAVGYAFLVLCVSQRQSMRFVLIAVGPMAIGVAWLASVWWDRKGISGRILVGILLAVLASEAALAAIRPRHALAVLSGRESADSYLARREPTFVVGRWIGENLPPDARIVGQDHRGFYLPRDYSMELAHRRRTGLGKSGESADDVIEHLKRAGFTHVLLCPPVRENAVEFDPTLGRLLASWLLEAPALYRRDLADADGVVRRYAIHALNDRRVARR